MSVLKRYNGTSWDVVGGAEAPPITLGYAEVTANQAGITAETDLTGLSVTVTVGSGRRVKVTGFVKMGAGGGDDVRLNIKEGATYLQIGDGDSNELSGIGEIFHVVAILTPSAGSHTYKLSAARIGGTAGTVTAFAGATFPNFILVEDITGGSGSLSGSTVRDFDQKTRTAGNVSTTSTSFVDIDTALDLVITAAAGDWLEIGVNGLWSNQGVFGRMEAFTWVSAATVNGVSGSSNGVPGWLGQASSYGTIGGPILYVVQAGDVSGGTVTLRFRYKVDTASSKTLHAESAAPFRTWARNLGVPPA